MIVIVLMKHNNSFNKFPGMYERGGTPSIEIVTSGFAGRAGLAKQGLFTRFPDRKRWHWPNEVEVGQ